MQFGLALDHHLDAIAILDKQSNLSPWSLKVIQQFIEKRAIWVVEQDGQMVGFWVMRTVADESELLLIAVAKPFRRQGIGKKILQYIHQQLCQEDVKLLHLEVRASNQPAIRLYTDFGMTQTGVRKDYYRRHDGREDALLFTYKFVDMS